MADVNANIGVGIDTSDALSQLKNLQRQISQFHQSVAKSSATAAIAQRDLQKNFLNSINAIQGFSAELRTVRTTAESFTTSLEKNKLSVKEYFRYAAGATKTFGKTFTSEFDTIEKTAIERVKSLQTQYIKMGRDANGAMRAIAIRPTTLDMQDLGTQAQITAQKQALFNQLIKQGSTQLLNFGKNTQWAGRQLMVGFTLPLASFGMIASRSFMEMETAALKFKKVYGDLFTSQAETQAALDGITELAKAYTQYGVAVADTVALAAEAAAAGYKGVDLQNQTAAATRLSVLGQIESNQALETTIALQNAFKTSSTDLATQIDFLNAVENQTVVSLNDITTAIPKVAPVIEQLGGDVKDLAFFMAAMKEGGINASEGANALKSGLGSLINPTKKASDMLMAYGINVSDIVNRNQGDLKGTVVEFAKALDQLNPLERSRAIEQMFGKFQFARLSTLFQNVSKDGTQAARVLELAGSSVSELAALSDKELGQTGASSMMKFKKAIEDLQLALAPVGQMFLEIATPFVEFGKSLLEAFNRLPDGIQKAIGTIIAVVGGLGPILLMTFGLVNNGIANMIKFFMTVRTGYLKITGQASKVAAETQYMTTEQLDAAAAASSLDQAHAKLTQQFTAEKTAVDMLKVAYEQAAAAGDRFAMMNPGMMQPGKKQMPKFANGGFIVGPGSGRSDSIGAMVSNGEAIIPADKAKKYAPLVSAIITGKVPGFAEGTEGVGKRSSTIGTVLGGTFPGKQYSPAAMMAPGNTPGGFGMDKEWLQFSEEAKASFAASLKTIMMLGQGIKVSQTGYSKFWMGLEPVLDEIFSTFRDGVTEDVSNVAEVGKTQYPLMIENVKRLQQQGKISADEAEQLSIAIRKLVDPLESDLTQRNIQRVEIGMNDAGDAFVKRAATERQGETYKPQIKRATAVELKQRGLSEMGEGYTYAHIPESAPKQTYVEPSLRKKAGAGSVLEQETMKRLAAGEILKEGNIIAKKVGEDLVAVGAQTASEGSKGYIKGAKDEAQTASPSKVTEQIGRDVVAGQVIALKDGVDEVKVASAEIADAVTAPITQASKEAKARPTFGTGSPVPVTATGNAPREIAAPVAPVQRTLAGDIRASMANFKPNLAEMGAGIKAEWAAISQQIKDLFRRSGQETVDVVKAYNNQLVINGKEAGFNYVAQMQGRDGAIEAVLTKKNAEIISGITAKWNAGTRDIPLLISDGLRDQKPLFDTTGMFIADEIAKSTTKRAAQLKAAAAPENNYVGMAAKPFGPMIDPNQQAQTSIAKFQEFNNKMSSVTFGLSALSGITSMFGGEMSAFSNILMQVTGAMFALMQITQLLTKTKAVEAMTTKIKAAGGFADFFTSLKGGASGMKGLMNGVKGLFGVIKTAVPMLGRLIPGIGGVLLAFEAFKFIKQLQEDQTEKLRGLSSAANMATDKIKGLGEAAGIEGLLTGSFDTGGASIGAGPAAVTGTEKAAAEDIISKAGGIEKFTEQNKAAIDAIKNAEGSADRVQSILSSIAIQFYARGGDQSQVEAIVNGLKIAAGNTTVDLDFEALNIFDRDGSVNIDIIKERAAASAKAFQDKFDADQAAWRKAGGDKPLEIPFEGITLPTGVIAKSAEDIKKQMENQASAIAMATKGKSDLDIKSDTQIQEMKSQLTQLKSYYDAYSGTFSGSSAANIIMTESVAATAGELKALQASFQNGKMTVVEFNDAVAASEGPLLTLGDPLANVDGLLRELEVPEEYITGIKDLSAKQALLNAEVAGYDSSAFVADLESPDANVRTAAINKLNGAVQSYITTKKEEITTNAYETTTGVLDDQVAAMEGQIAAYDDLKNKSGDAALAYKIVGDAAMYAAYQAAVAEDQQNGTTTAVANFIKTAAKLKGLQDKFSKLGGDGGGGGGSKADPYKDAIESLKKQRAEIANTSQSYAALAKSGKSAADALRISQDSQLLSAMADGVKVGSAKWKELVKQIEIAQSALLKWQKIKVFKDGLVDLEKQKNEIKNTTAAFSQLTSSGMKAEDAIAIATNPQMLAAMAAGIKVGSADWKTMVARIQEVTAATKTLEEAQKKINDATKEGRTENFNAVYDKVQAIFSANEAALDAAYEAKTKADKATIDQLQSQLEGINRQIDTYERDLDGIQEKEDAINKSYDEKVKALEDVKKINQDILNQQKSQLTIADALSQGDISAAARAMQESRAQNAASALENQGNLLEKSREGAIANVTGAGGKTRVQIEASIKTLKDQIYSIETGSLRAAEDRVKAADNQLIADKAALVVQGLTKTEWTNQKIEIDKAQAAAVLYEAETKKALDDVKGIVAEWAKVPGTVKTKVEITQTVNGVTTAAAAKPATTLPTGAAAQAQGYQTNADGTINTRVGKGKMLLLSKGGMVPKYFADGGFARGTDTVPAMLTPGEFVVNKSAVEAFGPMLSSINSGKFGPDMSGYAPKNFTHEMTTHKPYGFDTVNDYVAARNSNEPSSVDNSVYNYSISVSVGGSNADPSTIANAVMEKIKRTESQRVRGQVVR